jgi:hypothetical protein
MFSTYDDLQIPKGMDLSMAVAILSGFTRRPAGAAQTEPDDTVDTRALGLDCAPCCESGSRLI